MLNVGGDLTCLYDHTGGNPPPTAIWSKDGSDRDLKTGYSKTYLVLKNVGNKMLEFTSVQLGATIYKMVNHLNWWCNVSMIIIV